MSSQSTAKASPWIVSAPFDLTFFIATPLLALALILPITGAWSSLTIYLAVMSISSVGHHLPGFLRAYGDASLFKHFKLRFLLAPPLLFAVFLWFGQQELRGMVLILMLWSIWHVLMQHFGFMRIYDAKVGANRRSDAVWDRAVTLAWFISIVLWSPQYTHNILNEFYAAGGPRFSAAAMDGVRYFVWAATGLITFGYGIYAVRRIMANEPLSRIKLVLLIITISFLGYVWVGLQDLLLGLAIWEIFHDVQYFAITWIYNRRLVEKGQGDTRFMNFLFRKQGARVLLYVGAIAAYGGAAFLANGTAEAAAAPLVALIYTSTILHYYFDGFIWKVRDNRTREGFDLKQDAGKAPAFRTGMRSAIVQVLGFAIPIGTLAAMELRAGEPDPVELREALFDASPKTPEARTNLALAYSAAGRNEDAARIYKEALELTPDDARAHGGYATALLETRAEEGVAEAEKHLYRAMELAPEDTTYPANLAILRFSQNRTEEALQIFRTQVSITPEWRPRTATEVLLSGLIAMQEGELDIACRRFIGVLELEPENQDALEALAFGSRAMGKWRTTQEALENLLALSPGRLPIRVALVESLLAQGKTGEAVPLIEGLITDIPDDLDRKLQLAEILATSPDPELRDGKRAAQLGRAVVEATNEENVGALDIFAAALAESGDFVGAMLYSQKALALAEEREMTDNANAIRMRRELYTARQAFHLPGAPAEQK